MQYLLLSKYKHLPLYYVKNEKIACNHNAYTIYELLREKERVITSY